MAEPVSREAWSRLVALLNAYLSENSNAFSHSGPQWKPSRWTPYVSGLSISDDWSFPDRISRAMVKSMFEWSANADDMYRAFCACMVWAGERVANAPLLVKHVASQPGISIGDEVLKLKTDPSYINLESSPLNGLGPVLGTNLLNVVSVTSSRQPSIDQFIVDWMWGYGQVSEDWMLDLSTFNAEQYGRYSAWCQQALDRFRESGHLPDHCDDHAFIGFLMMSDRLRDLSNVKVSQWIHSVENFTKRA